MSYAKWLLGIFNIRGKGSTSRTGVLCKSYMRELIIASRDFINTQKLDETIVNYTAEYPLLLLPEPLTVSTT